jgi:hypothetical protein
VGVVEGQLARWVGFDLLLLAIQDVFYNLQSILVIGIGQREGLWRRHF